MTREEAINQLTDAKAGYEEYLTDEAIDMAIEALSVEPCEDAISRQAVLDLIADYDLSMGQVVRGIHALPSVTPNQKMGRWITKTKLGLMGDTWSTKPKCSECGGELYYSNTIYNYKFCPYCGAKMSENPTGSSCTDCVLDGTDACSRGAGRAVDGRVCEDFVGESED